MHEPRSLPRLLALLFVLGFLINWVGIAAPLAAAQQTVTLSGTVVDDGGQPVADAQVCAYLPTEEWWEGSCWETEPDGRFQLNAIPAVYVLRVSPVAPLQPIRRRLEVGSRGVSDLVLTVSRQPMPFVPDDPPKATLISISSPTADGEVTLRGAAGSVAPESAVVALTLDTGHFTTAQATADGSFTATLFAPAGTSVLIKADPFGVGVARFVRIGSDAAVFFSNGEEGGDGEGLKALSGTILWIADPPGAFGSAGRTGEQEHGLPAWTFRGALNTHALAPGDPLRVRGTVRVDSPALQGLDALQVSIALRLERFSDTDGTSILRGSTFASTFLTPTGLPIEREPRLWDGGLNAYQEAPLRKVAATQAEATVDLTLTLPSDLPAGYYRPFLSLYFPDIPLENPPSRSVVGITNINTAGRGSPAEARLPIIQVGNPAPPHLYWTLFLDTLSNGSRGVVAMEDADRFGIAQRILTTSDTFVIPRLGASGQALTYRLEPFVPTVGLSNEEILGPPLIPFRFPSGSLTVTIRQPDGTETVLGPAPFVQPRLKSLVNEEGGLLSRGGGHISDAYQLSTMDPRFEVSFAQDGLHVITVEGTVDDIWGNTWTGGGTYTVYVGRVLALDTAVLPGTHFEVGDGFNPGLVISPPLTAEIEVRLQHVPHSDISQLQGQTVRGRTNRFGYFQPAGNSFVFNEPGEYRVDIAARGRDEQGHLWIGSRTWGGVVAPVNSTIVAHGRRGIDSQETIGPQWFSRDQLGIPVDGSDHVFIPFQSGDVQWLEGQDSALPTTTFHDPSRQLSELLRQRGSDGAGSWNIHLGVPGSFAERVVVGEIPLFSSRPDGIDPHIDPTKVDLWAYSYRSVQRPLVRVREEIGEEGIPNPYWRFDEQYANQIGVGQHGDLPGEFKFQYGAAVLHGSALDQSHYAIYGSLFVLLPEDDPQGSRTFPPFQGNGGGPSGGPLFTLKGEEIDLFIHLTGVRPGSVLETGNTFALVGAVGPTLPAKIAYTVTAPDGSRRTFRGQANSIGYYYEPEDNFIVDQPGRYTVDLRVTYDGRTSAGQVTAPFPQGDVLGTARGRFSVYVVSPHSTPLEVDMPQHDFLTAPADFTVTATPPTGMRMTGGHMTALMPGVVLEDGSLPVEANGLTYEYDPVGLAAGVPMLDVERFGEPVAADVVTVSLFGEGRDSAGQPSYAARVVTLHGAEFLNLTPVAPDPAAVRDLERVE